MTNAHLGKATVRWPSGRRTAVLILRRTSLGEAYVQGDGVAARWVPPDWIERENDSDAPAPTSGRSPTAGQQPARAKTPPAAREPQRGA